MNCLVTGATGLVGQRLVKRLVQDGSRVRALVRGNPERVSALGAEVVRGDITEPSPLDAAVAGTDCVFHSAAKVGDWGSESLFQQVNVEGTRRLLSAPVGMKDPAGGRLGQGLGKGMAGESQVAPEVLAVL